MRRIVLQILHPVIRETFLPDYTSLQPERKSSLDELHGPFQRNFFSRRDQQMHMIRHDDEFVQQIFPFVAIMGERLEKEVSGCLAAEDGQMSRSYRGDEEDAVGVHLAMVTLVGVERL